MPAKKAPVEAPVLAGGAGTAHDVTVIAQDGVAKEPNDPIAEADAAVASAERKVEQLRAHLASAETPERAERQRQHLAGAEAALAQAQAERKGLA